MFGIPRSFPFQPLKPSIRKAQNPVFESLMMSRPSEFRIFTPNAPCITLCPSHCGSPPNPASCLHSQVKYQPPVSGSTWPTHLHSHPPPPYSYTHTTHPP